LLSRPPSVNKDIPNRKYVLPTLGVECIIVRPQSANQGCKMNLIGGKFVDKNLSIGALFS
jgi:hypothetical protein